MRLKIAIDAGHGPNTPGKRSPDGMREYEFNNAVAKYMKAELGNYEGVSVLFTHEDGRDVPLPERTNKANNWGADVLASLHANANTGVMGSWGGIDTFVYGTSGHSYKIAKIVQQNLIEATKLRNRGVKVANFHMLRETKMPAILIEHGFMDSTTDLPYLKSNTYRKLCGVTNARSIAEYYKLKRKNESVSRNPKYTTDPTDRIGEVVIGKEPMNYRKEPNLDAPILRVLPAGHGSDSTCHLYEERGHWLRLGVGWISNAKGAYATVKKYAKPPKYNTSESLRKGLVVLKRESHYHAEPTEHSRVLAVLKDGHGKDSSCHVYEEKGDWLRLGQGWVLRKNATVKPLTKKTIYRVIIDGKQVGAYSEDDNALSEARKAIAKGSTNIKIEKV
jgi:N-acetylmuramoyl-L-alanine amidase